VFAATQEIIAGRMFHPSRVKSDWNSAKADFQKAIDKAGPEFEGRTFSVFQYAIDERTQKTELQLLDNLKKQR
jgi:hypothetical protein